MLGSLNENWWCSGIMSNFFGDFFMFWGQKNICKLLNKTEQTEKYELKMCLRGGIDNQKAI